jgi:hypothetical protein
MIEFVVPESDWREMLATVETARKVSPDFARRLDATELWASNPVIGVERLEGALFGLITLSKRLAKSGIDITSVVGLTLSHFIYVLDKMGLKPYGQEPGVEVVDPPEEGVPSQAEIDAAVEKLLKQLEKEGSA